MPAAGHAYSLLSSADVGLINDNALRILERMGMEIQSRRLPQVLAEHGAGWTMTPNG